MTSQRSLTTARKQSRVIDWTITEKAESRASKTRNDFKNTMSLAGSMTDSFACSEPQMPTPFEGLCARLAYAGTTQLNTMACALEARAPAPGSLVYVQTRKLLPLGNGMEPVLFSAIDACTHLQATQSYLVMTRAAAVSFIDHIGGAFPFPIAEIETPARVPFCCEADPSPHADFRSFMRERGISHSIVPDSARGSFIEVLSRMMFGGVSESGSIRLTIQELQRDLGYFLFYHNNYRPIPWFAGKTPLQKLRTFKEFGPIRTFDPLHESVTKMSGTRSEFFYR